MIELIVAERCTSCGECVKVCPSNVFEARPEGPPVIARLADCQTCFLCELYCKADALYVGARLRAHGLDRRGAGDRVGLARPVPARVGLGRICRRSAPTNTGGWKAFSSGRANSRKSAESMSCHLSPSRFVESINL